jgi:hypothetical protein
MTEPPWWLTIDLAVIVASAILMGIFGLACSDGLLGEPAVGAVISSLFPASSVRAPR